MRPTEVLFVAVPLLAAVACETNDSEGLSNECCPKRIHELLKQAGGVEVNDHIVCGFAPSVFRPEGISVGLKFEHGLERLTEECKELVGCDRAFEYPRDYQKIEECTSCRYGYVQCAVGLDGEASCAGWVPDFYEPQVAQYGIPYFRMVYDAGLGTLAESYQDHQDRNHAVFHFRFKPDPRDQSVVERFYDGDYRVEMAGSCECEPYIAPPDTGCAPTQWE